MFFLEFLSFRILFYSLSSDVILSFFCVMCFLVRIFLPEYGLQALHFCNCWLFHFSFLTFPYLFFFYFSLIMLALLASALLHIHNYFAFLASFYFISSLFHIIRWLVGYNFFSPLFILPSY